MAKVGEWMLLLGAGDWLALGLFVFIGRLDHDLVAENPLLGFLTTFAFLALPWLVVGLLLGAFRLDGGWRGFFGRSLNAWLVAMPLALLIRALVQGDSTISVPFMLVTIGLGGAFLFGWRLLYWLLISRLIGQDFGT